MTVKYKATGRYNLSGFGAAPMKKEGEAIAYDYTNALAASMEATKNSIIRTLVDELWDPVESHEFEVDLSGPGPTKP